MNSAIDGAVIVSLGSVIKFIPLDFQKHAITSFDRDTPILSFLAANEYYSPKASVIQAQKDTFCLFNTLRGYERRPFSQAKSDIYR